MSTELELKNEWAEEAQKQTLETLPDFINHILNDYPMSYDTSPRAVAAIALAAAWATDKKVGLTGFQAGCTLWDFIDGWIGESSVGRRLVDYSKMLYPQYEYIFTEHTISKDVWENLQKEARKEVMGFIKHDFTEEELSNMTSKQVYEAVVDFFKSNNIPINEDSVLAHQMKIVLGEVPFGYTVKD